MTKTQSLKWLSALLFATMLCSGRVVRAADVPPAVSPSVASPAPSLIANGDFETDADRDGAPDGWKAGGGVSFEKDEAGNRFLRLKVEEPGKMVMVYCAVSMKPEYQAFELAYRVRYEGIKAGKQEWFDGRIMMNFKDAEGKTLKPAPAPPVFRGTKDWQARSQKFLVPEGAKTLEIMPCLFQAAAGTLDFDDFRLISLDAAAVAELKAVNAAAAAKQAEKDAALEKKADDKIAALLAAGGNLLENGDFQTADKAGTFPVGWGRATEGSGVTWEQDNGKRFLRLVQQEPGKILMLYRIVPLPADAKGLEVTARYRTAGVQNGTQMPGDARAILHWLSGGRTGHLEYGHPVTPEPPSLVFSGKAADWTEVKKRMLVPADATKLQLMPGLWFAKTGTVDLAEIRIAPISPADAEAMAAEAAATAAKKAEQTALLEKDMAQPAVSQELKVAGNRLVTPDGKPFWMQGLCVDSMEWGPGDNVLWSIRVALNDWHANVIRLPVHHKLWFGQAHKGSPPGDPERYRKTVDQAVKLCAAKGAYLVLDLHVFGAPMPEHVEFWKDAAVRYKGAPAVLYELFNEPHGIPWKIWRDGGDLGDPNSKHQDNAVVENTEKNSGKVSVGMQALANAIRGTGANNIIIAGGLGWSYDLSGILEGYALQERDGGNGIMYSHHNYPWKIGWQKAVLDTAAKHPIFIGEVGCPEKWEDFSFIQANERYEKLGPGCAWPADMLGTIQKYQLNWTGFSFHPRCGPMVIKDWDYNPTPYWGVFVKEALAGKVFEVQKIR